MQLKGFTKIKDGVTIKIVSKKIILIVDCYY